METTVMKIGGMTCGGCVRSVSGVLRAQPGVNAADVSLERGEARIEFDPAKTGLAQLRTAIEDAGYEAL